MDPYDLSKCPVRPLLDATQSGLDAAHQRIRGHESRISELGALVGNHASRLDVLEKNHMSLSETMATVSGRLQKIEIDTQAMATASSEIRAQVRENLTLSRQNTTAMQKHFMDDAVNFQKIARLIIGLTTVVAMLAVASMAVHAYLSGDHSLLPLALGVGG